MIPQEYYGISVSIGYIVLTALVMKLARIVQSKIFASSPQNQSIALEFISTFELIATAFELGVVLVNNGFPYYAGFLIILLNYWGSVWPPANTSPHPHIVDLILGLGGSQSGSSRKISLLKILAQVLAATVVFTFYVKPLWSFGTRIEHLSKLRETSCFANLKSSPEFGILTEAGTTLAFLIAGKLLGPKQYSKGTVPIVFVGLKKIAMPLTGCFMNPILASAIQFGCQGISLKEHVLVYWGGPVLGLLIFRVIIKMVSGGISVPESTSSKKSIKTKPVSKTTVNKKKAE